MEQLGDLCNTTFGYNNCLLVFKGKLGGIYAGNMPLGMERLECSKDSWASMWLISMPVEPNYHQIILHYPSPAMFRVRGHGELLTCEVPFRLAGNGFTECWSLQDYLTHCNGQY